MSTLVEQFQPIFDDIAAGAVGRELQRELPYEQVGWLVDAGFTRLQAPAAYGGQGIAVHQLIDLLIPLAQADSNLVQILHAHFGFTPLHITSPQPISDWWLSQVGAGKLISNGMVGDGEVTDATFSGTKKYTTGALFADELFTVVGANDDGSPKMYVIPADAPGVELFDDWDGVGQRLTASGTTTFTNVALEGDRELSINTPAGLFANPLVTLIHAAAKAGIALAAVQDATDFVRNRKRTYGHAVAEYPKDDPLVQEVVGKAGAHAQAAVDLVRLAAQDFQGYLDRITDLSLEDDAYWELYGQAVTRIYATSINVSTHSLEATQLLYEVGGASVLNRPAGFDRHWRNVRVLASHNPAHYKLRSVGDYHINGTTPVTNPFVRPSAPQPVEV